LKANRAEGEKYSDSPAWLTFVLASGGRVGNLEQVDSRQDLVLKNAPQIAIKPKNWSRFRSIDLRSENNHQSLGTSERDSAGAIVMGANFYSWPVGNFH
jgi:hypothetical protein